jgi:hypothetical protein
MEFKFISTDKFTKGYLKTQKQKEPLLCFEKKKKKRLEHKRCSFVQDEANYLICWLLEVCWES